MLVVFRTDHEVVIFIATSEATAALFSDPNSIEYRYIYCKLD